MRMPIAFDLGTHGLLLYPPKAPFHDHGSRHYHREIWEEANWLGPALLVSEEAAMHIARIFLCHVRLTCLWVSEELVACGSLHKARRPRVQADCP